jgi:SAM-dependent methyltransferase
MKHATKLNPRDWFDRIGEVAVLTTGWSSGLVNAALQRSGTAADLAARAGVDERVGELLLDALVAHDVLAYDGEQYRPSPAIIELDRAAPFGAGHIAALWSGLPTLVRTGTPATPQRHETFYPTAAATLGDWSAPAAEALATQLRPVDSILDVGAGSGVWSLSMARRSGARVIAIDLPGVADLVRQRAGAIDLRTIPGDYHRLPFPEVERVVLANVLHLEQAGDAAALVRRAASAVRPGGDVVIVDSLSDTSPEAERALSLYKLQLALRVPGATVWPLADLHAWLSAAGLACQAPIALGAGELHTAVVGVKSAA